MPLTAFKSLQGRAAGNLRREGMAYFAVESGGCGQAVGARAVADGLRATAGRGLPATVIETGCGGRCSEAVNVRLWRADDSTSHYREVPPAADRLDRWAADALRDEAAEAPPAWPGQTRVVLQDAGAADPQSLDDYLNRGGYVALERALSAGDPLAVVAEVKASGLRGRGGAYFPVALKWEGARAAAAEPKYLVLNAEEGEPGIFKDRHLLESDPHLVLEGMAIAAFAAGCRHAVIFLNGEAPLARQRLATALRQAEEHGLLGKEILGTEVSLQVEVRLGAGGYILGEETALFAAIEGKRAQPSQRPPFPTESGLRGKPTVINNAESLANVPHIVNRGASWFSSIGTPDSRGTKLVSLTGNVRRRGLVEVAMGTSLHQLVQEVGGGVPDGRRVKALLVGGPSGGILPAEALDTPIEVGALQRTGAVLGAGGVVVLDDRACPLDACVFATRYNAEESCGKCTPCREGTVRALRSLGRLASGDGARELLTLERLNRLMGLGSLCGLGQMAPNPIATLMRYFKDEVEAHMRGGACPAGVCAGAKA